MMFGAWGEPDHDESIRIIHAALEAGINFIDTADVYSAGESETIVGKALAEGRRDNVVLATKLHAPMGDDVNMRGNSRRWIVAECENSLRRLGTDHIDLYQIHRPDPSTDIGDTLSALDDLVRQGKVRYAGCSTFPAHEIVTSHWVAEKRNLEHFRTEQPPYSIFARRIEADVLPVCQEHGMGVIPWSPLNQGWLTGRYRKGQPIESHRASRMPGRYDLSNPANATKLDKVEELVPIAEAAGISMVDMAIGFVLAHPAVTSAIIGPRTMDQLTSQLGSGDVVLDAATMDAIDAVVPPGTTISAEDNGYQPPALAAPWRRRRPAR
jgi:aryl-alcohol dehydrogenase-like predicted oxidoreductase